VTSAQQQAAAMAWGRVALGTALVLAPRPAGRPWFGSDVDRPAGTLLVRSLGARDLALGVGVLLALRHGTPVRGWVEGGVLADGADLVGALLAFRHLPKWGRLGIVAAAGGAAVLGRAIAPAVD
jgi:hypothetical protein